MLAASPAVGADDVLLIIVVVVVEGCQGGRDHVERSCAASWPWLRRGVREHRRRIVAEAPAQGPKHTTAAALQRATPLMREIKNSNASQLVIEHPPRSNPPINQAISRHELGLDWIGLDWIGFDWIGFDLIYI